MRFFAAILTRDLRLNAARMALPVAFFLLVATLYPFAVGPDAALLGRNWLNCSISIWQGFPSRSLWNSRGLASQSQHSKPLMQHL